MKAKNVLAMFLLSVSLVACSYNVEVMTPASMESVTPTFTPWVAGTETALANPTLAPETQTAQALVNQNVLPTFPPPADIPEVVMEKPTDFSPVLYGGKVYDTTFFLLLGGVSTDAWITPDESVARFSGEVTYSLHNMTTEAKYFLWGKSPEFTPTCKTYMIGTEAVLDEGGFVGVVDGWAIMKRPVDELSSDSDVYRQAVIDWLTEQGVSDPQLVSVHIYRVDLEGDGLDEIFLSATHLDASQHTTRAGDYSIVLMRKVSGNEVVTKLVVGDVYKSKELETTYPITYSLANFIDLNQDGVLEVMVESNRWEGFGASLYEVHGENVEQVLAAMCG